MIFSWFGYAINVAELSELTPRLFGHCTRDVFKVYDKHLKMIRVIHQEGRTIPKMCTSN